MLQSTSFEEFQRLSQKAKRVVVCKEIFGDTLTPVVVFKRLHAMSVPVVLLDSSDHPTQEAACVYMGVEPLAEFNCVHGEVGIRHGEALTQAKGNPFALLREFYQQYRAESEATLAKFAGGMIGFLAYEAMRFIEECVPTRHLQQDQFPDLNFKFYRHHVVFDKRSGKVLLATVIEVGDDLQTSFNQAQLALKKLLQHVIHAPLSVNDTIRHVKTDQIEVDVSDEEYEKRVARSKHYIREGDAFQIVLSRSFQRAFRGDDFDIYRALRVLNPSPYQFYIRNEDYALVGSSPERLVSLQHGVIETMPIAGTRPRGETEKQDQHLASDLLADEKEIAEHMMLVDLGRNDIGRLCEPGSVNVVEKATVHRYSTVMHLVSRVQGNIKPEYDAFDVLQCAFPAGTLTGAPKIRAMEIIDELEESKRGFYGGSICAIDNTGDLDSCITIRTALVKEGVATVRAGAGLVLDSDAKAEADETRHKAQTVLKAIALAEEGMQ